MAQPKVIQFQITPENSDTGHPRIMYLLYDDGLMFRKWGTEDWTRFDIPERAND